MSHITIQPLRHTNSDTGTEAEAGGDTPSMNYSNETLGMSFKFNLNAWLMLFSGIFLPFIDYGDILFKHKGTKCAKIQFFITNTIII